MRRRNWRVIIAGVVLIVLAAVFFLGMMTMIPHSNDPVGMMREVGEVSGGLCGLSLVMIVVGLVGKKV
jgi:hypothetical protein